MNISFCGIKNAGSNMYTDNHNPTIFHNGELKRVEKGSKILFHAELTNQGRHDLDELRPFLKEHPYCLNHDAIDIQYTKYTSPLTLEPVEYIFINDKDIKVENKNIALLTKINKFLKNVAIMPAEEIKTENSYIERGDEASDAFRIFRGDVETDSDFRKMVEKSHNPDFVKEGAKRLSRRIEKALTVFLSN